MGNKTEYAYTPEGWLASITKPDGKVITYTYDKTGNLLAQDAAGEEKITQEYNSIGQLTVAETKDGKTEYQYNDKGQLVQVKYPDGSVLGYTYDEYGRKSSLTYPDGKKVRYEYDEMDRLVKVIGLEGEETEYTYNKLGQRTKTDSDGLITTYAYDKMGNVTEQKTSGASALELAYTYTPGGRMASEARTEDNKTITIQYQYDLLGQLTSFTKSDGYAESYTYDAVGNMKQKVLTQGGESTKLSMRYNAGNQMTSMQSLLGKIGYSYDKNGNLAAKQMGEKRDSYAYDAQDRLTSFTGYDGFEQRYSYDAMGLRASMERKGNENRLTLEEQLQGIALEADAAEPTVDEWVKTGYIYDITLPYGQLLQEATDGKVTSYAYGCERISAASGTLKTQYVYDGRGSVAQTVAGGKVSSMNYTPFGEQLTPKVSGFGYNAEWYDAATSMQNLRARQYEPGMMRFSQKDILRGDARTPLSLNRYLCAQNDPINFVDPSGMAIDPILARIYGKDSAAAKAAQARADAMQKKVEDTKKTATAKAKSAASAAGNKAKELAQDWLEYRSTRERRGEK